MAQGNQNEAAAQNGVMWAESAARAGYTVHEGVPYIGVSGDEGDGFLVGLGAPSWFGLVGDEPSRDNVFRALAAHALRVGQGKLKAADKPTREIATDGANSALNGAYKPSRERSNDIVDSEASRQFTDYVRAKVLAVKADATESQIAATVSAQSETDAGKALLAKMRGEILAKGTYAVSRKGKGSSTAVAITIG